MLKSAGDTFDVIMERLIHQDNSRPDDYVEDGIRFCAVCHEPKQYRLTWPNGEEMNLVPVPCRCMREEAQKQREQEDRRQFRYIMKGLWAEYGIMEKSFLKDTFDRDDGKNRETGELCRRYVGQWNEMEQKNIGLLFCGPVGTGKSFYAAAIANALLEQHVTAAVTNFPRLLNTLQNAPNRQGCIDHLQRYRLLVIDDLGTERDTNYGTEQIYNVIDARARSERPLIVTTNLTPGEIKQPGDIRWKRIFDRVLELCPVIIPLTGESRREEKRMERKQWAASLLSGRQTCAP